jgi:Holliday junction resolvase
MLLGICLGGEGWFVVRAAASKPVDLVCLKNGEIALVECKYGVKGVRWAELAPLLDAAERTNAKPSTSHRREERKGEDDRCRELGRLQALKPFTVSNHL